MNGTGPTDREQAVRQAHSYPSQKGNKGACQAQVNSIVEERSERARVPQQAVLHVKRWAELHVVPSVCAAGKRWPDATSAVAPGSGAMERSWVEVETSGSQLRVHAVVLARISPVEFDGNHLEDGCAHARGRNV